MTSCSRNWSELSAFLAEHGGAQKCYVDTGPVLERDYAAEAGIGWHGKSTMLIDPKLGTWFFLGGNSDHSGSASRRAATGPLRHMHALHHRLPDRCDYGRPPAGCTALHLLPDDRAKRLDPPGTAAADRRSNLWLRRLPGCVPLEPLRRGLARGRRSPRAQRLGMPLRDYLALDDAQFRALFRGSPIKRIKRRGFLRNVCVALGNAGDAADLPALRRASRDPEPLIAEHAAWALERIRERSLAQSRDQRDMTQS